MPSRPSPIPAHTRLERLFQGTTFSEGPAADAAGNVYFSDCQEDRIYVYRSESGKTEIWKEPSGRANGMKDLGVYQSMVKHVVLPFRVNACAVQEAARRA